MKMKITRPRGVEKFVYVDVTIRYVYNEEHFRIHRDGVSPCHESWISHYEGIQARMNAKKESVYC